MREKWKGERGNGIGGLVGWPRNWGRKKQGWWVGLLWSDGRNSIQFLQEQEEGGGGREGERRCTGEWGLCGLEEY